MDCTEILTRQRSYFAENFTKTYLHRLTTLTNLETLLKENEELFLDALLRDLGKSREEAFMMEIGNVYQEISFIKRHLKRWMKDERVKTPLTLIGSKGFIRSEPYGNVLVIAPWNYPFQLALVPLIGAIASGNTVVLKPSELAPHTAQALNQVLSRFREEIIAVVEGDKDATTELLKQKFDYIFFTGSSHVGRIVMEAAAKHLTPVTLELGGKSPLIVTQETDLKLAARRVAFGKFANAGQTCIAPDYAFVHEQIYEAFKSEVRQAIQDFYGKDPLQSEAYGRIVNVSHFERLKSYVPEARVNEAELKIEPCLLDAPDPDSPVMQDEIFGPILPIYPYSKIEEVIAFINARPKPLALYLFTTNRQLERQVLFETSSGGVCINDTLMHIAGTYLPFGGVGESGMGSYHGYQNFRTFSHERSVLRQTSLFDFKFRYPGAKNAEKILRFVFK